MWHWRELTVCVEECALRKLDRSMLAPENNWNEGPFICPIQPRLGVGRGNTHYTIFEYMGAIWIAWVAIGRCWWLWSGYGYKFEGKCRALLPSELHVLLTCSLCKWNPNQLLVYSMKVNIYILDFEPSRWNPLNMGYMNKRPSRMQRQFYFSKVGGAGNNFQSGYGKINFFVKVARRRQLQAPSLSPSHPKVRRGGLASAPKDLDPNSFILGCAWGLFLGEDGYLKVDMP